ncbi:hypothetical protein AOLI_G00024210 [Acnodon oligacanthus]
MENMGRGVPVNLSGRVKVRLVEAGSLCEGDRSGAVLENLGLIDACGHAARVKKPSSGPPMAAISHLSDISLNLKMAESHTGAFYAQPPPLCLPFSSLIFASSLAFALQLALAPDAVSSPSVQVHIAHTAAFSFRV